MNGPYLPPGYVCSAYWYAARTGMLGHDPRYGLDPGDLEFLRELGLRAASLARWEGIPAMTVPEGPWPAVYLWPERIWSAVADAMAQHAAEHGDYGPENVNPPSGAFTREEDRILAGAYGPDEPIPVPRGDPEHPHGYWEAGDYG